MLKDKKQNLFREKRLVWMGGEAPSASVEPPAPADAKKAAEQKEAIEYKEKLDPAKIDEIADRVKKLNLPKVAILKDTDKGSVTAPKFKQALNEALKPLEKELNVKNLDQFLLNGLLENLGKADAKISTMDWRETNELNNFLKKNNVAKFTIEDGYWKFFDKADKAISADFVLDGTGNPSGTAVLGSEVKERKDVDAKEAADKEAADKADAERTDPKTLEQVKSDKPVSLGPKMTVEDLAKPLEQSVLKDGKPAITSAEIQESFQAYVSGYGGTPEQNFAQFMTAILEKGYTECKIDKGRLVFTKNNEKASSNPLGLKENDVRTVLYAHPKMGEVRNAEAQKAVADKVEAAKPKPTPFGTAEREAVKIITGKEKPDERDENNANIDARYLPAVKSILAYPMNGVPVDVKIPFNDRNPVDCKYYVAGDGSYVLSWDKGTGYYRYKPTVKGEDGHKEAQRFFVANLNNGRIFQEVQRSDVNKKGSFEQWGMEVDDGPKPKDGGTYYEFDWKGSDPDVVIYTEPHGALRVVVDRKNVGPDGKDHYEFRSGGFQDMIRTLKRLQRWAESEGQERDNMRDGERDARFFEDATKGVMANRAESLRRGAGKLLNVVSVRNFEPNGKVLSDAFARGYMLDFDWMQKEVPPIRLQMFRNGTGNFEYYLMPTKQKLGETDASATPQEALTNALVLVAQQRELLTTQGGEKLKEKSFQDALTAANESVEGRMSSFNLTGGVKVESISASGVTYLSMDGMSPVAFRFGRPDKPNMAEFRRAVKEGYLVRGSQLSARKAPGEASVQPEFVAQRKDAVVRILSKDFKWAEAHPNFIPVRDYLMYRVLAFTPPGNVKAKEAAFDSSKSDQPSPVSAYYEQQTWKLLADWTDLPTVEQLQTPQFKSYVVSQIKLEQALSKVKPVAFMGENAGKWPQTNVYLAQFLDTMAEMSHAFDQETEFVAVEKVYRGQVESLYKETVVAHPKTEGVSDSDYDRELQTLLKGQILRPDNFIKEYKKEGGRVVTEKVDTKPPEQPGKVEVKLDSPTTPGERNGVIPLFNEKGKAVKNILTPLKGFVSYQEVHTYVSHRLSYMMVEGDDDKAKITALEAKVWSILAEMTGVVVGTAQDKAVQNTIMAKLKDKGAPEALKTKYDVPGVDPEFRSTRMYIKGLVDSFADLQSESGLVPDQFKKATEQYQTDMLALFKELRGKKKQNESPKKYDERIMQSMKPRVKLPKAYLTEYKVNEDKRTAYERYQADQKVQADRQTEYQDRLTKPHQMTLDELASKPVAGMVAEALTLFKTMKSVPRTDVFFSRMKGNIPFAQNEACFNVKAGKAPGPRLPMTLHVFREGGELRVSATDGWNNVSRGEQRDWVGAGPDAVDTALKRAIDRHTGLNTDVMASPAGKEPPKVAPPANPGEASPKPAVAPAAQPAVKAPEVQPAPAADAPKAPPPAAPAKPAT